MPTSPTFKRAFRSALHTWPLVLACSGGDPTPANPGSSAGTGAGAGSMTAGSPAAGGTTGSGGAGGSSGVAGGNVTGGNMTGGTAAGGGAGTVSVGGSAGSGIAGSGTGGSSTAGNGAGGSGAGGSSAGATSTAGSSATGLFKDDFESGTAGMQPPGWENFISYNKNAMNPNGMLLAVVDTTHVHGGTKALHVKSDGAPVQLAKALTSGMNKLYIRVWVYMTRKLGQQTDMGANHETLIALRAKSGDVNNEIRFGEIKGTVGVNETPSDNIAPTMDKWHKASGALVPAATWACIEVAFLADSTPNTLRSWQNGATLFDVTSVGTDQWQNNSVTADWLAQKFGGSPSEVVIGWQSFSSAANEIWFDDLVLSTSPIGCD
jgi:polysaccharide lyase-like protein